MILAAFLLLATADVPNDSEQVSVHAVMFELEYDMRGNIRHAQALGGYPSLEACRSAMPRAFGEINAQLAPGLTPQLLCSSIKKEVVIATQPEVQT